MRRRAGAQTELTQNVESAPYLVVMHICCVATLQTEQSKNNLSSPSPSGSLRGRNDCRLKISRRWFLHANEDRRDDSARQAADNCVVIVIFSDKVLFWEGSSVSGAV